MTLASYHKFLIVLILVFICSAGMVYQLQNTDAPKEQMEQIDPEIHTDNNITFTSNTTPYIIENITYNAVVAAGGGGGSGGVSYFVEFNQTECDITSKKFGVDCTCFSCWLWVGYDTRGFYNTTGVYYEDGTPTRMTMEEMAGYEEEFANIRYDQGMNSYGHYRTNGRWV